MLRTLLTIMRTNLLWSLNPNLLQNRTKKLSTITKHKIIFPVEIIQKRLLLILIIYITVFAVRSNNMVTGEMPRNFIVHPVFNNLSIVEYYHLYIFIRFSCSFCISIYLTFFFSFSCICFVSETKNAKGPGI